MDVFRKTVAVLCAISFVISGVLALFCFNIEKKAFTSATYKQAFENQNLYERMPEILADALFTASAGNANAGPYLKALTVEEWRAIIASLLPPEETKALTDDALDSTFDYLNDKTDSASVSLLPVKRNLAGPAGMEAMKLILRAQPDCTAEQLLQMGLSFLGGDIALCNPPNEMLGLMTPLLESQLQITTAALPDRIILISGAQSATPDDPRLRLNRIRALLKISPVFPLFFLVCVTALAARTLVDWLKWWGAPFLITGGISFLAAMLGAPALAFIIQLVLQTQGAGFIPPILFSTLRETVHAVSAQILRSVAVEGLVLTSLGFGMFAVAIFLAQKSQR